MDFNDEISIASITVLYNPDDYVARNIDSYGNFVDYVILIDNTVDDNFFKINKCRWKNCIYIPLYDNYGIAKALNIGIHKAKELGCNWVLTMDQDSYIYENIIDKYKDSIIRNRNLNIAIISPIYLYDRGYAEKETTDQQRKMVMQSANLLSVNAYDSVGEFDEKLFIDGVDYEYCLRLRQQGYVIIQCHDAYIKHSPAETRVLNLMGYTVFKYGYASPQRYYYQARNLLYIFVRYKNFYILFIWMYKLWKIIFLFDKKKIFIKFFIKGVNDYFHGRFGKIRK